MKKLSFLFIVLFFGKAYSECTGKKNDSCFPLYVNCKVENSPTAIKCDSNCPRDYKWRGCGFCYSSEQECDKQCGIDCFQEYLCFPANINRNGDSVRCTIEASTCLLGQGCLENGQCVNWLDF